MFTSCLTALDAIFGDDDNPTQPTNDAAQLKQGIWTEYDEALLTSGKYTAEELAKMPTVGMKIEGDKGYFFAYTAEDTSEAVEGKINYNKAENTGTISFPTIKDSPLSNQTVNFSMVSDDVMEFDYTYEGQKTTGTCAWLCENLDNWSSDITDEDWQELMAYYEQQFDADAGPDAAIDWSDSDVAGLDEPLPWDDNIAATRARTRAIGIGTVISIGSKILGALFQEEKYDPKADIQEMKKNLNKITGKLDEVLKGQEQMMSQMNLQFDKVNDRLNAIAQKLNQQEAVTLLNNRNTTYFNPLNTRNTAYFDGDNGAYKLYNDNKDDLSKVSAKLGEYAKEWVGPDGEKYIELTWNYIESLFSMSHSTYGTGMDKIYDGMTFDKYPWEHMGIGDRLAYRAYDIFMITKSLFMITLYASYCDISDVKKNGIYKNYLSYIEQLKGFCEFDVTNPDEFLVCQIPGAHFVMHKEIQKYYYKGKNNEAPNPDVHGPNAVYRPEWHQAGSVKIDNPYELPTKLIDCKEAEAIFNYYKSAVYPTGAIWWMQMLVEGDKAAGAVLAKQPENSMDPASMKLLLYDSLFGKDDIHGMAIHGVERKDNDLWIGPLAGISMDNKWQKSVHNMGFIENPQKGKLVWGRDGSQYSSFLSYYAAIVEKRY